MKKFIEFENCTKLEGDASMFIAVPDKIVFDEFEYVDTEILLFTYLQMNKNFFSDVLFYNCDFSDWLNVKPSKKKGEILDRVNISLERLKSLGFIKFQLHERLGRNGVYKIHLESYKIMKERFAMIYFDEINKIFEFKFKNGNSSSSYGKLIKLLSYFRLNIYQRKNEFYSEEREPELEFRRKNMPEAFSRHIKSIAEDLNIDRKTTSKMIDILVGLDIIIKKIPYNVKYNNNWYSPESIFANAYKRQNGFSLASGENYYLREIESKETSIVNLHDRYELNYNA